MPLLVGEGEACEDAAAPLDAADRLSLCSDAAFRKKYRVRSDLVDARGGWAATRVEHQRARRDEAPTMGRMSQWGRLDDTAIVFNEVAHSMGLDKKMFANRALSERAAVDGQAAQDLEELAMRFTRRQYGRIARALARSGARTALVRTVQIMGLSSFLRRNGYGGNGSQRQGVVSLTARSVAETTRAAAARAEDPHHYHNYYQQQLQLNAWLRDVAESAGVAFLNMTTMLSMRPDAMRGSLHVRGVKGIPANGGFPGPETDCMSAARAETSSTDDVHYCTDGVPPYALEEVLRAAAAEAARR